MHPWFRRLTFPLRATLVTAVTVSAGLAVAMTVGAVGYPAYVRTKKSIQDLWKDLAEEVAQNSIHQVLLYFQTAPTTLKIIEGLVEEGHLNLADRGTLLDICYRSLKENRSFDAVYYARVNGTFYGVFRIENEYVGKVRLPETSGKTLEQTYEIHSVPSDVHQWVEVKREINDYDPRLRPFWKTGTENLTGAWTDPYKFATTQATGYTYVLAQKENQKTLGYWAVDFQIDHLDSFLQSLDIGKEGEVYIIADDGTRIAQSTPRIRVPTNEEFMRKAWNDYKTSGKKTGYIDLKKRILYIDHFPIESQIPWNLATMIHENDFLVPIRKQAYMALGYGLMPSLLFLFISALFFGHISRRLKQIAWEMDRAGNLSIQFSPSDQSHSFIREVNVMNHSLHKMKMGLHSFSRYVPTDLVKKVLDSLHSIELGATKKDITVLFADLAQFTSLAEELGAEKITQILGEFLDMVTTEVHKEKGIIDKFLGDAIMALWGAPKSLPHHPVAACRAALAMKKISGENPRLKHKVGINSGFAMVGNFGSQERMEFTAIGDSVNIAARLEKLNKRYGTHILIGPNTAKRVQEHLLVRPLDWVILQGKLNALLVYELMGEKEGNPMAQGASLYAKALETYVRRRFSEAEKLFEQTNTLLGGADLPSQLLAERCRFFEKEPPPEIWDGTEIFAKE